TLVVRHFAGDKLTAIAWLHARFRGDSMADYRPISVGAAAVRRTKENNWSTRDAFGPSRRASGTRQLDQLFSFVRLREERLKFDRRLASSRWSDSTGRVFHPQGSNERFQSVSYISFSFPKLAWRNLMGRSVGRSPCARRSDRPRLPRLNRLRCRRTDAVRR